MMEYLNVAQSWSVQPRQNTERFVLLLSPFAPHIAEELWKGLGHKQTLAFEPWPQWDPDCLKTSQLEIVVQVNGKRRGRLSVCAEATKEDVLISAKSEASVAHHLAGKAVTKEIYVPGKLVNLVVK